MFVVKFEFLYHAVMWRACCTCVLYACFS